MKYIKVTEFAPPLGREYDATAYPGPGIFLHPASRNLVCVSAPPFSSVATACMVGCGNQEALIEELQELEAPAPTTSYSEDFILKALAIAQQPQLAVSLLKGTV